jgi:uncharacterized protein (TIGR02677 family)
MGLVVRTSLRANTVTDKDRPEDERVVASQIDDTRRVLIYLVVRESAHYIAIMQVLESSIADLTPREVGLQLHSTGVVLDEATLEVRLDKLREWGAVSARTDTSRILRHADLLARNWRYTATPAGRQAQRFYRTVLAGTPSVREIPLSSLARVVDAAETLASGQTDEVAELVGSLFVHHDDLDAALVGAEDSLAGLVDRFDLDDAATAELKQLLVGYATHVAAELERGSSRAHRALVALRGRFGDLARGAVTASDARALIERGALTASRGGRVEDWESLLVWFDPTRGRAYRFALRLVRALPGMHVNLRRLHSSSGAATSRSRALALARACAASEHGPALLLAVLGDHPWRKLHGAADDADDSRIRAWRDGPRVEVPELLRATGRTGARGRAPAARDDTQARETVRAAREQRAAEHATAIAEILAAAPGARLSAHAGRVALVALVAAVRSPLSRDHRSATRDGLSCTLFSVATRTGLLATATWRVLTPGRVAVFHLPGNSPETILAASREPSEVGAP